MEKNQKETGITLSFLRSDAIHWTRKRIEKKACPRNPIVSQKCSDVIIAPSPRWLVASCYNHSHSHYPTYPRVARRFVTVRGIDQPLVSEVWREITSYPPGRIDEEARDFLARQPEVAAFAHTVTAEQDPVVQRAGLGLCFLLFKILERAPGHPLPRLVE